MILCCCSLQGRRIICHVLTGNTATLYRHPMHLQEAQNRRPPSGAFSHRSVMAQRPAATGDVGMRAPALLSPFEETPMSRRTIATPNSLLNSRKFRGSIERPATRDLLTGDPYQSSPVPSHAGASGTHTPGSNVQVRTLSIFPAFVLTSYLHQLPCLHAATHITAGIVFHHSFSLCMALKKQGGRLFIGLSDSECTPSNRMHLKIFPPECSISTAPLARQSADQWTDLSS